MSIIVSNSTKSATDASWQVSIDGVENTLYYTVTSGQLSRTSDAALAATILPAMKLGGELKIKGEVSSHLLTNTDRIQRVHRIWRTDSRTPAHPVFQRIEITATERSVVPLPGNLTAAFFSGGIDSFFTTIEHADEISHLIYIHGFEKQEDSVDVSVTVGNVREAAKKLGLELIEVDTNARELFERYVSWAHYHGSLLASVALLLAPQFRRIYIPSTHDVSQLFPWGSHPETDPWLSNEECSLVHDRCDVTRLDKTAVVSTSKVALDHLRVCWRPTFNCGKCNKCVRTRLGLQALRASSSTFTGDPLTIRQVRRMSISENSEKYFTEIADFLRDEGRELGLADAIDEACSKKYSTGWRGLLRRVTQPFRVMLLPLAKRIGLR